MTGRGDGDRPSSGRWVTTVAGSCVGLGLALLLAAVVAGNFSRTWATQSQLPIRNLGWDSSTPAIAAGLAMGVGLLVFAAVVVALAYRAWIPAACVAGVGALATLAYSTMLRNYGAMTTSYTSAQQVPAAFAAWLFAAAGAVAALVGAVVFIWRPRAVRWLPVSSGVAVGVVTVIAVSAVLMRDADPGRDFDATTAAGIATPPIPGALGVEKRFALQLDVADEHAVLAAGAGFVARVPDGVRAFDSAGQPRWHYLHNGQPRWKTEFVGVFDDGATVVVGFDSGAHMAGEVVGLDAVTGELLWRTDKMSVALTVDELASPGATDPAAPFYLTVANGSEVARIDTRTGKELWQTRIPYPHMYLPFDTHAGIGYFSGEARNTGVDMRYVSLDPQTGTIRFDVPIGTYRWEDVDGVGWPARINARHAGRDGMVFTDGDGSPQFFNAATGDVAPFDAAEVLGPGSADEILALTAGQGVTLREAQDGRVRCTIAGAVDVETAGWLGTEVLLGYRDGVSAYRRSDCSAVSTAAPRAPAGDIVVAPGVVLIVMTSPGAITVTGYS
ncbi:outer membrane protein assembly factor BamB family protein [Mycolicibacterium mageritense]|uniref:outer membrane protein assembly factor BamB family protein n=1 Tax=Mycolicibacterium mageritense TaxID=53462 RepID=UPI001E4B7251|nr:PQQ-binding-like beta-propeller repeat protein [Mycolicibacterium mageritense]GJJ18865.1 hypothetical protein MTY414_25380 [Mycolicibacterium mageritense]